MKSLRKYFEDNHLSYSYLFFAAVVGSSFQVYTKYTVDHPEVLVAHAKSKFDVYFAMLYPLIFVGLFLVASFITFKTPKDVPTKIILWVIHLIFASFIIMVS